MAERGEAAQGGFILPPVVATAWLTAIAGYVDAFSYVHLFGAFPANQSGNAVLLGIAAGEGQLGAAASSLVAIVGFGLGVALGVALDDRSRPGVRSRVVLAIELVLLAALTVAVAALGLGDEPLEGVGLVALLLPASLAMGVQTPVVTRTHGVPTPTTYMTGAVTHLSEALTEAARHRAPGDGPAPTRTGAILATAIGGYVAGAALGTVIGAAWTGALLVPTVALAVLLVARRA